MSGLCSSEMKELSSIERELSIVISSDAVNIETNKAYQRLGQKVRLKGFRQGKAPRQLLEQHYKADVERDVLDKLLKNSYKEALSTHGLEPVATPHIESPENFSFGRSFSFKAVVEVKPQVKVKKWKDLKLSITAIKVGDAEVDSTLESLRQQHSTISPVTDRDTIEQGDLVVCQYSGMVDGQHEKSLSNMNQTITVGSGHFFPEIEQALVGHKVGDSVSVDVAIPPSFKQESLREKTAHMQVAVNSIKTRILPALDDDFAKDIADEYQTLGDLRAAILKSLETQKVEQEKIATLNGVVDALIEANPIELPPSLIKQQAEYDAYTTIAKFAPKKAKELFSAYGAELAKERMPDATKTVHISLICEAIAAEQNIEDKTNKKALDLVIEHAKISFT